MPMTDQDKRDLETLARKRMLIARNKGDDKAEFEALKLLRALEPIPQLKPMGDSSIPIQSEAVGLINGEARNPTILERFFNTSLERPGPSNKELLPLAAAAAGSTVPGLGFTGGNIATKLAAPFIRNLPKIAGASIGGGAGEGAQEFISNDDATLESILSASGEGAKNYALAEAAGVGVGALASKGVKAFLGQRTGPQGALEFARQQNAPLPLSSIQSGGGAQLEKASDITYFGNMIRRNAANKINQSIQRTVDDLTPLAKTPEVIAPRAQVLLKETLESAGDAKNVAYTTLETAIGKKTVVNDSLIKDAIGEALDKAAAQGKSKGMKELKTFRKFDGARTFEDLERFRKDTLNKITGSYKTKEIGQVVDEAFQKTYMDLGKQHGIDLTKSIQEANKLMTNLTDLKKIPGLEKYAQGIKSSNEGWITGFVNENNTQALKILKDKSPETYESLIQQRLSLSFFNKEGQFNPEGYVKWVRGNKKFIQDVYGAERQKVFNNFADYMESTSKFTNKMSQVSDVDKMVRLGFTGSVGFGTSSLPTFALSEAGGSALAYTLTNPNTWLYKVFSESDPIKIGQLLETTGQLSTLPAAANGQ